MKQLILILILLLHVAQAYAQQKREYTIIMRNVGDHTLYDGSVIRLYGFATTLTAHPTLPGPTIYAEEGDTVVITARNVSQGEPHTIHLHGLDVDMENDGVGEFSFHIHHAEIGTYTFVATHAGTYLYHCHVASIVHVQMGMYGKVIVAARNGEKTAWTNGPAFNKEYAWLMSEVDKAWHDNPPQADSNHHVTVPEYLPDYFLVNGKSRQQLEHESTAISAREGEKVYMRLANMGFLLNEIVFPPHFNATIIDSDGRPLPNPIRTDTILIFTGERYGVMLEPSLQTSGTVKVLYKNMNSFKVEGEEKVPYNISGHVGLKPVESKPDKLVVYPNPSNGKFTIELPTEVETKLQLINMNGKLVFEKQVLKGEANVEIDNIPAGAYIIRSISGNEIYHNKLLVF